MIARIFGLYASNKKWEDGAAYWVKGTTQGVGVTTQHLLEVVEVYSGSGRLLGTDSLAIIRIVGID